MFCGRARRAANERPRHRRFENILFEAGAALRRGDSKTYAVRDREFYENLAEQSENSALIEALARVALQIQLCGTMASVGPEFAERAAHGCDDIIQAFKARETSRLSESCHRMTLTNPGSGNSAER